jgi:hypothetical protein
MEHVARWFGMSEINEKTRVAITVGGAIVALITVLGVGRWWGQVETERATTARTLERHESDIRELRDMFRSMESSLQQIKNDQSNMKESTNAAVRNTTFLITEMGAVKIALAERGIRWTEPRGGGGG